MRIFSVALIVLISVFAIASCNNNMLPGELNPDDILPGEGAYVRIMLPSNASRGITLGYAQEYTDYFQVTFKRLDTETPEYFSADASTNDQYIEMRIPSGQYDILLLAGNKDLVSPRAPLLLASAYKQEQEILLEGVNTINLILKLVEFEINIPSLVDINGFNKGIETGSTFEVIVNINFHNPLIDYSDGNILMSYWLMVENNIERETIDDPYFNPSTGVYAFSNSYVAVDYNEVFMLSASASSIKPFEYDNASTWNVSDLQTAQFMDFFRTTDFWIVTPQVNINIQWCEE